METDLLWLLLAVLLLLDLLFTASRASFTYLRLSQLEQYAEANPSAVDNILQLVKRSHLPATLRLSVVLMHFMMAGVASWLTISYVLRSPVPWWNLLWLALWAVIVLCMEFVLEGQVLKTVELWTVRLLPVAHFQDAIFVLWPAC